jgi:saccharopine dehydrogenase (NAD+, L-lysine-forming)
MTRDAKIKVAVLGGFGLMAEAALHDLAAQPQVVEIYAVDLTLARAKAVLGKISGRRKIKPVQLDLTDVAAAAARLAGVDVVLNCAWYEFNLKGMELALSLRAHYVDLGGLYHMTLQQLRLQPEFKKAGRCAVLGCGSTPGITNMMLAKLAEGFATIDSVGIYDASHDPDLRDETFLPPFSIRTMLAEFVQPAPVFRGGRLREVPPHSDVEELELKAPLGRVKLGTVIHSELATCPGYLAKKGLKELFFKIMYPESVRRQLSILVGMGLHTDDAVHVDGALVSPRHFVTALAQKSAVGLGSAAPQDFEILRVRVRGTAHGRPLEKTWDCEMRATKALSAGAMGVGFAGGIATTMVAAGQTLMPAGVAAPESMLQADAFFAELRARTAFSLVETVVQPVTPGEAAAPPRAPRRRQTSS